MHMSTIMPSISKVKTILFTIPPLLPSHLSKLSKFLPPQTVHTTSLISLHTPFLHLTKPFSSLRSSSTVNGSDSQMETVRSLPAGEIHVIVGPMFAGKTTALIHRILSDIGNGRRVAIIKSNKDSRYELDSIVTHDGEKMSCWALPNLSIFKEKVGVDDYEKLDVIAIDEAQFFGDLYDFCRDAADHDGKIVVVAGLDGDYLRRSFGSVLDIIPLADSVTKLTSRCELCGKLAHFTLRKTEEKQTELIGGADVYMPVCRQHYVNGQIVIEAARKVLESQKNQCDSYLEAAPLSSAER